MISLIDHVHASIVVPQLYSYSILTVKEEGLVKLWGGASAAVLRHSGLSGSLLLYYAITCKEVNDTIIIILSVFKSNAIL